MSETGALCGETTFAIQECVSQKAKQQFAAISFNRAKFDFIKKKKKENVEVERNQTRCTLHNS